MMARQPREPAESKRNREQLIADLRERAAGQARAIVTGEDWAAWLRVAARFPAWSFTNVMLVAAQRPAATFLASYEEWQGQGRQVRKGEPGIQVIAEPGPGLAVGGSSQGAHPAARAAGEQRGPQLAYVWDVSQTSGPPDPDLAAPPLADGGGARPGLWDALTWLARREGFAVERADCLAGDSETRWGAHRIRVSPRLDSPAAARALVHELGHVLAHASPGNPPGASTAGCRGIQKVEADSIACIVATRLGMDTSIYTWPYVASWAGGDPRARPEETVRAAGERITHAAGVVVAHLDAALFGVPGQHAPGVRHRVLGFTRALEERVVPARRPVTDSAPPIAVLSRMLADAERFYRTHLSDSWVLGNLAARGLNSPETALYAKGDLLFGLHEAREQLARGAMPVIVEGPFDAIAVGVADAGSYVGLAPCGTALTIRQVTALAGVADLDRTGVLVALDGDRAGHDGIVKAYEILLAHTGILSVPILPSGQDPAGILQTDGPTALCDSLRHTEPLAQVVIC